jgi:catechol 2,3-dioxygenase-like lactoylglutathione lyase family enzyme
MTVQLNHTIVHTRNKEESARLVADLLGLPEPTPYGPFLVVECGNGASLDFADGLEPEFTPQHYAFLVSEDEFNAIKARIEERGIRFSADPFDEEPGRINTDDGGRGLYWSDPSGHRLEIITVPYGGWNG